MITDELSRFVNTPFAHPNGTVCLKQFLKTFNYNFILVYYNGDLRSDLYAGQIIAL